MEHEDHGELKVPITPLGHFLNPCKSQFLNSFVPNAVATLELRRPSILGWAFSKAKRPAPVPWRAPDPAPKGASKLAFGWHHVEKRFDEMAVEGKLSEENFGGFIGEENIARKLLSQQRIY